MRIYIIRNRIEGEGEGEGEGKTTME